MNNMDFEEFKKEVSQIYTIAENSLGGVRIDEDANALRSLYSRIYPASNPDLLLAAQAMIKAQDFPSNANDGGAHERADAWIALRKAVGASKPDHSEGKREMVKLPSEECEGCMMNPNSTYVAKPGNNFFFWVPITSDGKPMISYASLGVEPIAEFPRRAKFHATEMKEK